MNIIRPLQTLKHWIMSSLFPLPYYIGALESITPDAETMGFEPMRGFTPYLVSSEALSTTQPRLHLARTTYWLLNLLP
jgi:hypothetical protein